MLNSRSAIAQRLSRTLRFGFSNAGAQVLILCKVFVPARVVPFHVVSLVLIVPL
jgi:hypothetical protein